MNNIQYHHHLEAASPSQRHPPSRTTPHSSNLTTTTPPQEPRPQPSGLSLSPISPSSPSPNSLTSFLSRTINNPTPIIRIHLARNTSTNPSSTPLSSSTLHPSSAAASSSSHNSLRLTTAPANPNTTLPSPSFPRTLDTSAFLASFLSASATCHRTLCNALFIALRSFLLNSLFMAAKLPTPNTTHNTGQLCPKYQTPDFQIPSTHRALQQNFHTEGHPFSETSSQRGILSVKLPHRGDSPL